MKPGSKDLLSPTGLRCWGQYMVWKSCLSIEGCRRKKALERSWAKVFSEDVFPYIDEDRFSVLYSDKNSRPNTPINVIVGAEIIKMLFDYSDDEKYSFGSGRVSGRSKNVSVGL